MEKNLFTGITRITKARIEYWKEEDAVKLKVKQFQHDVKVNQEKRLLNVLNTRNKTVITGRAMMLV